MRQSHVAGERMFVNYAGTTLEMVEGTTGEVRICQLFVATLRASNYTYAEATLTQRLVDWIGSHVRAFASFGGVTTHVAPDNLRSGITKACFYEPAIVYAKNRRASAVGSRPHGKARLRGPPHLMGCDPAGPKALRERRARPIRECGCLNTSPARIVSAYRTYAEMAAHYGTAIGSYVSGNIAFENELLGSAIKGGWKRGRA
jgi:hypothetical protein